MTKRLAFRKCRGVARNRGLLALALMLFVVAMTARRAPSLAGDDASSRFAFRESLGRRGAFGDGDVARNGAGHRGMALRDEEGTRFGTGRSG